MARPTRRSDNLAGGRDEARPAGASRDQGESTGHHTGRITRIVSDKGFGFIQLPDKSEYFFHRSSVLSFETLTEGQTVQFDGMSTHKGLRAVAVVPA